MASETQGRRVRAMLAELDAASDEYSATKELYEATRIKFEAAKERFAGIRRLATGVLSERDWLSWQYGHSSVQFVGMRLGDAISRALVSHAFTSANEHYESNGQKPFFPGMSTDQIQETLEQGGFEFRTSAPRREVHAALINLEGVKKKGMVYISGQAQQILSMLAPDDTRVEPEPEFPVEDVGPEPEDYDDPDFGPPEDVHEEQDGIPSPDPQGGQRKGGK